MFEMSYMLFMLVVMAIMIPITLSIFSLAFRKSFWALIAIVCAPIVTLLKGKDEGVRYYRSNVPVKPLDYGALLLILAINALILTAGFFGFGDTFKLVAMSAAAVIVLLFTEHMLFGAQPNHSSRHP